MVSDNTFYLALDIHANIISFEGIAVSLTGYTEKEVIGKSWFEIFVPEANTKEISAVFDSFLQGDLNFWEYENEIVSKDGTHHLIQWKNSLRRGTNNKVVGIHSEGILLFISP